MWMASWASGTGIWCWYLGWQQDVHALLCQVHHRQSSSREILQRQHPLDPRSCNTIFSRPVTTLPSTADAAKTMVSSVDVLACFARVALAAPVFGDFVGV